MSDDPSAPRFVVESDREWRYIGLRGGGLATCLVCPDACKQNSIDPDKLAAKIAELLNDGSLIVNCDEAGEEDAS